MKIIIFGGNGFIGKHLASLLKKKIEYIFMVILTIQKKIKILLSIKKKILLN